MSPTPSVTKCGLKTLPNVFKICVPKEATYVFCINVISVTMAQNVTKYLGYFCKTFCQLELSKMAHSGHTVDYAPAHFLY